MSNKATIKIPRNLYNNLNKIIENTGFNSVTEFVVYVLRDLVSTRTMNEEEIPENETQEELEQLTGEEIDLVRKRLKSLGYL